MTLTPETIADTRHSVDTWDRPPIRPGACRNEKLAGDRLGIDGPDRRSVRHAHDAQAHLPPIIGR